MYTLYVSELVCLALLQLKMFVYKHVSNNVYNVLPECLYVSDNVF